MSCPAQFSSRNKKAFMAALDRIAAANREPSPREAGCLFSALGAMASGAERSAEQWIARCQHADSPKQHAWNAPARLTVDGLRVALVELTRIGNINGRAAKYRDAVVALPLRDNRPSCAWCDRGKLDVIEQWSDPHDGIIGVTLKCDAPQCGRLTTV
jgi:hypothetical protein